MKQILTYCIALLLLMDSANAQDTLHIYGPGGPFAPMKECSDLFSKQTGTPVKVTAGPEANWIKEALDNADIIFGGAEYMIDEFMQRHPGFLNAKSRSTLLTRSSGILVRPGNPKKIRSVADLGIAGMRIMVTTQAGQTAMWEELAIKAGKLSEVQKNIYNITSNSAQAINAWKTDTTIDAWLTYASWYYRLKDIASLVTISPHKNIKRGTPIAVTEKTNQKEMADRFVRFLSTAEAKRIFIKWGWNKK